MYTRPEGLLEGMVAGRRSGVKLDAEPDPGRPTTTTLHSLMNSLNTLGTSMAVRRSRSRALPNRQDAGGQGTVSRLDERLLARTDRRRRGLRRLLLPEGQSSLAAAT